MGKRKKELFDVGQGHGNHLACLHNFSETMEFIDRWLELSFETATIIAQSSAPISCNLSEDFDGKARVIILASPDCDLHLAMMVAVRQDGKSKELVSVYPECEGTEVEVKLTAIHEWATGCEATLEGVIPRENECQIAFFDTRYPLCKDSYIVGETYTFRLAALAYKAEILEQREFSLEGQKAIDWYKKIGDKPEYEDNGEVKAVVFNLSHLVALIQPSVAYPDDGEFQSPVFDDPETIKAFDTEFLRLKIAATSNHGDDYIYIPLFARKEMFRQIPRKDDPIRGTLWLTGYYVDKE